MSRTIAGRDTPCRASTYAVAPSSAAVTSPSHWACVGRLPAATTSEVAVDPLVAAASRTVSVTAYVPGSANEWEVREPLPVVPSPNDQAQLATGPSGSLEAVPSKATV